MRIRDRGEVRVLLEVWTLDDERAQAATDIFVSARSGRRAHGPTRTATTQLFSVPVDHYAHAGTSIVEPWISFEATGDRRRRVRAVIARRVWIVPFRNADSFGNNCNSGGAGFSTRAAATYGRSYNRDLAQCAG